MMIVSIYKIFFALLFLLYLQVGLAAQSTEQEFPTPITTNEITASIMPRAVGDSRNTTYYYNFEGQQGDIFVNVITKNLNGDIDIFIRDGLRPLTKIVVYADIGDGETGRVIYLRKPEKLLLRVSGKTPNDDPASIQIKFAGSFVAAVPTEVPDPPKVERRIIEETASVSDKTSAPPEKEVADQAQKEQQAAERTPDESERETPRSVSDTPVNQRRSAARARASSRDRANRGTTARTSDNTSRDKTNTNTAESPSKQPEQPVTEKPSETVEAKARTETTPQRSVPKVIVSDEAEADQKFIVEFKNGAKLERSMKDILRFTVDRGVLTIIGRNGRIARYEMNTVKKLTIE